MLSELNIGKTCEYFRTIMRNKVAPKYALSVFPQLELIEMMTDRPIITTLRPLIKSYHA